MKNPKLKIKNLAFCITVLIFTFFILHLHCFAADQLTITTYYPSPYGSYRELRAQRMAIGNTYINNSVICWGGAAAGCPGGSADPGAATSLVVEGNVGIGTSNPQRKLHVLENNLNVAALVGGEQLIIEANDAGMGIYSKHESFGSSHLDLVEINSDGSFSDFWALARVANVSAGNPTADGSFRIYYGTNPSSYTAAGNTDMLTIQKTGNVGIGTASPDVKLDVDGDIEADLLTGAVALGNVGYIAGGANGGMYKLIRNTSSKKYKKNIADFTPGLEIVNKLRPVIFNWKSSGEQDFGFVAEEAEEVNPLLITKMNGQVESFRYTAYTAILTNAIKEQQKEIENLKSAVAELSKKLETKKESP